MDLEDFNCKGDDRYGLNSYKISFSTQVDLVGCPCTPTICLFDLNRHIYVVNLAYRCTFSVGRFLHYPLQSDTDTMREEPRHEA